MSTARSFSVKYLKNPIITGTVILTIAGFLTKFIGFFFRIFLSRIFQNEELGIVGLISPVSVLIHSVCAAGMQNSITKYVAASKGHNSRIAYSYLFTGSIFSCCLSFLMTFLIWNFAPLITEYFFHDNRCIPMLKIVALSFPPASLHSCINGFFYARKKTSIPSVSMIIEQCIRVLTVFVLYGISLNNGGKLPIYVFCIGLLTGECSAAIFSSIMLFIKSRQAQSLSNSSSVINLLSLKRLSELFHLAIPLSLNRVCVSLLSTIETVALPGKLVEYGLSTSDALSIYGVFSGMAFPVIMFPCAITGSAASLLLPAISEAESHNNYKQIRKITILTIIFCFILGVASMLFLLSFEDIIGKFLFSSNEAASQMRALSFTCPFLYLSGMLSSILNGLGKAGVTFLFHLFSDFIRLLFIFFVVPKIGFTAYIFAILCSQICTDFLIILALRHYIVYN